MIFSTLLRPPKAPPEETPPGVLRPMQRSANAIRQRSRRYDRALAMGISASVVLHVLAVFLSPLLIGYVERGIRLVPPPRPVTVRPQGMQAVEVQVVETPPAESVTEPEPLPDEPEPAPIEPADAVPETGPVVSAAERLRPRVGDWRLWVIWPLPTSRDDMTVEERAEEIRERLYALIEAYDDSLAAEMARAAEARDWTVGEGDEKWGVAPGRIHLGPITLPLPFYLGPTREQAADMAYWGIIQQQAGNVLEKAQTFPGTIQAGVDNAQQPARDCV